jgi:hypothetical protein
MKKSAVVAALLLSSAILCIIAGYATSAFAAINNITVDEFGHMTIDGNPGQPGFIDTDPISGQATLAYQLPFAGRPGDVPLTDAVITNSVFSDLLRFPGNGRLYFFSLINPGDTPSLADVSSLPAFVAFPDFRQETSTAQGDFTVYSGFGGDSSSPNLKYVFISNGVPEPSSFLLAGMGTTLLLVAKRRHLAKRIRVGRHGQRLIGPSTF